MSGEGERWRDWLARHGPALVLFARQFVRTAADAEDAVQEGFVRFWRARERTRDSVACLYSCVRAAAIDLSRAEMARKRREEAHESKSSVPAFDPQQAELATAVEAALGQVPSEQREVVVMKIWGELTFSEIGEALAISPNTAASRFRYALEHLEVQLADEVTRE